MVNESTQINTKDDKAQIVDGQTKSSQVDSLNTQQVVVFDLAGEEYAVPILDVQEIIPAGEITALPNVPTYIPGIINVRGSVATVINLVIKFSLERKEDTQVDKYIMLTNVSKSMFGILVDEVSSVTNIPENKIKDASGAMKSNIHANYIQGVAVMDERVILILDLKRILDERELEDFAQESKQ